MLLCSFARRYVSTLSVFPLPKPYDTPRLSSYAQRGIMPHMLSTKSKTGLSKESYIGPFTAHFICSPRNQYWLVSQFIYRLFIAFFMLVRVFLLLSQFSAHGSYRCDHVVFQALPIIFVGKHHFTISQTGLTFLGIGIGVTIGCAICIIQEASHYQSLISKWKSFPPPEERLFGAMLSGPCLVLGCIWLGWTGQYESVPWYVLELSTLLIGTTVGLVFTSFSVHVPNNRKINSLT